MLQQDDWLTVRDAAKLANYHEEHVRRLIRNGEIVGKRVVIVWLVSRTSLLSYVAKQTDKGERRGRHAPA